MPDIKISITALAGFIIGAVLMAAVIEKYINPADLPECHQLAYASYQICSLVPKDAK
jgi:hypothetical protein